MLTNTQKESIGVKFVLEKLDCHSPYGVELLRRIAPFGVGAADELCRCFDNIDKALSLPSQDFFALCGHLAHFLNIRGIAGKCESQTLNEVELFEVKSFLLAYSGLMDSLHKSKFTLEGVNFPDLTNALDILDPKRLRIAPFSIENNFSNKLAEIRQQKARVEASIGKLGLTEELLKERAAIVACEDDEEIRIMEALTKKIREHAPALRSAMDSVGEMDLTLAKARLAKDYSATRPKISASCIMFKEMSNPYMEEALAETGKDFKKVSIKLQKGATVITGANMGGKSVAIKTAALNTFLCQMGFFVFASEAEIPLLDDICIIAEEEKSNFMSSFGSEMSRMNEIIPRLKNERLLIALDEPARGTNPAEGYAIVRAIVSFLSEFDSFSVIATHYDKTIPPGVAHYQTAGLSADAIRRLNSDRGKTEIHDLIDYNLVQVEPSAPVPKDALNICRIIGLDGALLEKIEGFMP